MKVRLTDPKCMHLRWRKVIFDNPFTRLKYILCSPLLSLINFSWKITLARITPYTWGQVQKKKILNDWKFPNNSWGHEKPQWLKVPKQCWGAQKKILNHRRCPYKAGGHEEISKGFKNFEQKQKKSQYNGAQNQIKKTKRKSPSPALGGTVDHFTNQIQGPEMYEQKKFGIEALVILSLKVP